MTRPIGVWVISIWYFISVIWTAFSFFLIKSGVVPVPPASQKYFDNLNAFDYISTFGLLIVNLLTVIYLFKLKKVAIKIFTVGVIFNCVVLAYNYIFKNYGAVMGQGNFGVVLGIMAMIAVIFYMKHLEKKGILT